MIALTSFNRDCCSVAVRIWINGKSGERYYKCICKPSYTVYLCVRTCTACNVKKHLHYVLCYTKKHKLYFIFRFTSLKRIFLFTFKYILAHHSIAGVNINARQVKCHTFVVTIHVTFMLKSTLLIVIITLQ